MKIRSVEAIPVAASFTTTFRFGTTDRSTSPNVFVLIETDDGVTGIGEACPVPAFTSETQSSIVELVSERVAPVLVGQNPLDRVPLLAAVNRVLRSAPFTIAAVDTALLDLMGRALDVPVHALLGGSFRDRIEVHGSVGWDEDPARMVETALGQVETYTSLKLYAGRGSIDADLDRLQAVRDAVGPDIGLFVDVNAMWTPSDLIEALRRVDDIGLSMIEQPLPASAAALQRQILAGHTVDIAADEAVRTPEDAARVVAEGTSSVINLGHSKLGGPTAAMNAAQIATSSGVGVMVGSVIEMGVATAMGLHIAAALPRLSYPSYLMGPLKYAQQVTEEQIEVIDGCIAVPQESGLGCRIDESEIRRLDLRNRA